MKYPSPSLNLSIKLQAFTAASLKSHILASRPKRKLYKNYKAFDKNSFNNDLKSKLDSAKDLDYSCFDECFANVRITHAPIKI